MEDKIIITISGEQYDVTDFASSHPGGKEILVKFNGKDATEGFNIMKHSKSARKQAKTMKIQSDSAKKIEKQKCCIS